MRKFISILLLLLASGLKAQETRLSFSLNPGWSIQNSENSMPVTREKSFHWLPGLSFAWERENVLGQSVHLEYNLTYRRLEGVLRFAETSEQGPEVIGHHDADLALAMNNLDVDMHTKLGEHLSVDYGPTLSCISRTFSLEGDELHRGSVFSQGLEDRLISYGLGVNGALNFEVSLGADKAHWYFFSSLKLRYLHALWFDARGRNVDDYYQTFYYTQLHIGTGYSF